jgi:hypothetical protein
MTCKGCEKRKTTIRSWLGVDDAIRLAFKVSQRFNRSRINEVLEAGAALEERVAALEAKLASLPDPK